MFKITLKLKGETVFLRNSNAEEIEFSTREDAQNEIDAAYNMGVDISDVNIVESAIETMVVPYELG